MMTPEARLRTAPVGIVGLNPGGEANPDDAAWDVPEGNRYMDRENPLHFEVVGLCNALGIDPERDLFAAQSIPFRSKSLAESLQPEAAFAFSRNLLTWTLRQSPAKLWICMGEKCADEISRLIGARHEETLPTGWGTSTFERYVEVGGDRVVVSWPHPSRHALFSRRNPALSLSAVEAVQQAARAVETSHSV